MPEDWQETRREFQRMCAKEGVRRMAERLPAGHATVYRIISGETQRPARAVKAAIERVVEEGRTEEGQEKQP